MIMKRILNLGRKECIVCGSSFQPSSGAQMTCSPECKKQAKEQGLTKRGPRNRGGVDPALQREEAVQDEDFQAEEPQEAEVVQELEVSVEEQTEPSQPEFEASEAAGVAEEQVAEDTQPKTRAVFAPVTEAPTSSLSRLQLDLSPVEAYIRQVVEETIRKEFKEAVNDALDERLRALFSR